MTDYHVVSYSGSYLDWQGLAPPDMYLHHSAPVMDRCPRCHALARLEIKRNYELETPRPPGHTESIAYLCHECQITLVPKRVLVEP